MNKGPRPVQVYVIRFKTKPPVTRLIHKSISDDKLIRIDLMRSISGGIAPLVGILIVIAIAEGLCAR